MATDWAGIMLPKFPFLHVITGWRFIRYMLEESALFGETEAVEGSAYVKPVDKRTGGR